MRPLAKLIYVQVLLLLLLCSEGNGQCAFEGNETIADLDTTSIPIFVSSAVNNDLSTNNGLKAVTVHFDHEFLGDILIELVSPSGQTVTLVGPSVTLSANTTFATWDIQFFANSLLAIPDQGYDPIWNSLQTWVIFTTYVGKYYPHEGMLEDFNQGPVNGTWTFNIIDNSQFGEGHIYCLDLIFCEEEGIETETCALVNHTLSDAAIEACQGDSELELSLEPELEKVYDPSDYGYGYILYKDGLFQSILPDQDLTSLAAGTYSICGILYSLNELSVLNDIPQGVTTAEVDTYILDNDLCANTSQDCVDLVILPNPVIVTEERSICIGDSLVINGESYFTSGMYDIFTPLEPCDSMSILDLTVYELEIIIDTETDTLSCAERTSILDGSMTSIPMEASVLWNTIDGNITSKADSMIVHIDRPGTYTFGVTVEGCTFSKDIIIEETDDFAYIDYSSNILTCILDSTFIDLTVSDTIDSISWSGPFPFSELNEDIRVGSGGVYTVTLITNFGCELTQEIEVIEIREYPELMIFGDTLSCTQSEVVLTTFPMDNLGSTFRWYDDTSDLSVDTFLVVNAPGLYSLEVITELGCEEIYTYDVISEIEIIEAELISDTIDCNNDFVTIAYTSDTENLDVLWKLPNGDFIIDSVFSSSQVGTYELSLNDSKGCLLDTSLVVNIDSLVPEIEILEATFLCGEDSIQLITQSNYDDLSYIWIRPDGTIDTLMSPFIYSPGRYTLEACRTNGCCVRDTIFVGVDNTVPLLTFEFDNLNCKNDTVYIVPSDTSSYLMEWSLDGIDITVDSNIVEVTATGFYEVVVTDELNGCKSKYSFDIESDYYSELDSLFAEPLNCANTEVQISTNVLRSVESYLWSGPGLLDANLSPMVDTPGEYILEYTYTTGCSGTDTIEVILEGEFPNLQGEDKTITCNEDNVTLEVQFSSSSASLVWTGPDDFEGVGTSVEVSDPGIYTVVGVAIGSCKDTIELELLADTIPPLITIVDDGEITCVDSVVLVSATIDSNTDFYSITGPGVVDELDLIFEVETPGIYTIAATGLNGCATSTNVEVTQSTEFPDYSINLDSLNCEEAMVTVGFDSSDPNLSVLWNGPMAVANDLYSFSASEAGNYVFSITNSSGCNLRDSFFVLMDTFPPNGAIELSSHINCSTDSVTLSIANFNEDLVVNWTGPGIINPSASEFKTGEIGLYSLTLQSENGCITEDEIVIQYDTLSPEITILGDPINCSAGKTFLRVDSDLNITSFDWTGPVGFMSSDAEPLIFAEGIYDVTVMANNGCVSSASILVEDERVFPEIEVDDFYLPCDGTAEEVFATVMSEGSFVRWFGPNEYFSELDTALVLEAGEYISIAFNLEGCTATDTFQVIDEAILPEFSGFSELLLCLGPVPLTAVDVEDDLSLYWSGADGFFSEDNPALAEEPGSYQLVVTGENGCVDSIEVEVVDGRIYPDAVASIVEPFQCLNTEVSLSGDGSSVGDNYTTMWSTVDGNILQGGNTLSPKINQEGTYVIEIKDTNIGCISYDTLALVVQEQDLKGAEFEFIEPTCLNFGNAEINLLEVIGGFAPFNILVDDYDYGERTNIQYLKSGEHLVTIIDSIGCQHDTLVVIPDDGVLSVELPIDTSLCFGDSLLIQPIINLSPDSISSIVWSSNIPCDGCSEYNLFLNQDIEISIEVTDIGGCVAEDVFHIKVSRPNNLAFPQIFSPNGDNINDVFYMPMTKGLDIINYIKIYDNWGGLLYHKTNLTPGDDSNGWRGVVNGQNTEIGVYLVEALVTLTDGSTVVYIGDLTLVR